METKADDNPNDKNSNNEGKSFNIGKNTQLEIYDISGRKLNLSICKEDIKIMKYIGDVKEIDIDSSKTLSEQGIDVFNASDKFFNDLCHPYDNPDGKDIILSDRRNDIYKNVTFCQDGCTYAGMNYTLKAANCLCNSNSLKGEENNINYSKKESDKIDFDKLTKSFIENLLNFNFDIVKCYNIILNMNNLLHNIGFLCLSSMFVLQIIFFFIYLIKKLKPLKYFLLIFRINNHITKSLNNNIPNNKNNNNIANRNKNKNIKKKTILNPPPKNNKSAKISLNDNSDKIKKYIKNKNDENSYNRIDYKNDIIYKIKEPKNENPNKDLNFSKIFESKIKLKNNVYISNDFSSFINIQNPISSNTNQKRKLYEANIALIKDNKKTGKKILNIHNLETISKKRKNKFIKNKTNKVNTIKLSKTDSDIQNLEYEEAIIYDKRTYLRMFWGFLVDSQIIIGTFFTDNNFDLFIIKLSFLVFTFQISFFLNAFFYSDEYISDAYHNDGVLDFFSGLPKSIYSFIATLIITNLLRMLSSSRNELMRIIRKYRLQNNYENIINIKLKKLRIKLIIYFILVFLLESFFLYYVTIFCAIYRYSQKYWFYGCLESFGMDLWVSYNILIPHI